MARITIDELDAERRNQVVDKGFTKEKDDENMRPHHWVDLLRKYVDHLDYTVEGPEEFIKTLIKIGAIAVAARESIGRTEV